MMKRTLFNINLAVFIFFFQLCNAQTDSIKLSPPIVFGSIYPGFVTTLSNNNKPNYAFEMNTALAGFKTDIAHKVNAILIYDVTKTTEDITVTNRTAQLKILHFF